jgi:hypothetical protein
LSAEQSSTFVHAHLLFVHTVLAHSSPLTHESPTLQFGAQLAPHIAPIAVRVHAVPAGHGLGLHGSVSQFVPVYPPVQAHVWPPLLVRVHIPPF